jgi:hypothetical protein
VVKPSGEIKHQHTSKLMIPFIHLNSSMCITFAISWIETQMKSRMSVVLMTADCSPHISGPWSTWKTVVIFCRVLLMSQSTLKIQWDLQIYIFQSFRKGTKQTAVDKYYILEKLQTFKPP